MYIQKLKPLLSIIALFLLFSACEKAELTPTDKLEGQWAVESLKETDAGQTIEYIAFASAFYPCVKDARVTFKGGKYTNVLASTCKDADGQLLLLFPSSASGAYSFSGTNEFSISDDGTDVKGTYVFETNDRFVFKFTESGATYEVAFVRK